MNAVIMAGGKGTRLLPLTADVPKPMIKIIDKPVLEHTIELLKKHGITEIGITLGYMPEKIISYFGDGSAFNVQIKYFIEDAPLGTAGSVKRAKDFVTDDFLILSGDAFTEIDLTRAMYFHKAKNAPFTLIAQPNPPPYGLGILEVDADNKVTDFIEKPDVIKPSLINTGIYLMKKQLLDIIPDGFYDFGRQLIPRILGSVYAYVDYSYWSDIGTLVSYYNTNARIAGMLEAEKARISVNG